VTPDMTVGEGRGGIISIRHLNYQLTTKGLKRLQSQGF
jgi:hypothetical protein